MVIPTLNEADELPATLAAARAALGSHVEIIVVDGGSQDGTVQRVDDRTRLLHAAAGRGRQLNVGAEAARADTLLFLHADTHLSAGTGTALARALAEPGVLGGCFKISLRGPTATRPIARALAWAINLRSRFFHTATGDQAIFIRRAAFQRLGGYSDDDLFEDVMLYRRLRRLGAVTLLDPAVQTSERRWRRHGYLRTIAIHLALRLLFLAGVPSRRLARLYRRLS
ncbi:MAG: TIGR04283 family arsenosugar biosynthesis glycosyltransferase [Gemmatimonadota bacterium]|nr:MAG: TIGR04283 family arsenosugar biosynthesis glycosyltransferase [Gemmatimonadota bacterium]